MDLGLHGLRRFNLGFEKKYSSTYVLDCNMTMTIKDDPLARLAHQFFDYVPDNLLEGTVYVSTRFASAVHKCWLWVWGIGN